MKHILAILLLCLFIGSSAQAFPETIRHGYQDCRACHVSQSGGSFLTAYGRELSRELLSTWGKEGEEKALYGVANLPSSILTEGHIRFLQSYLDNDSVERAAFFPMQVEAGLAYSESPLTVAASVGMEGGKKDRKQRGKTISPQHYIMYTFKNESNLRAGKFQPTYGLKLTNHMLYTRTETGFGYASETYNLEFSWPLEFLSFVGTYFSPAKKESKETGGIFHLEVGVFDNTRIGSSYLSGYEEGLFRKAGSLFVNSGISKKIYLQAEADIIGTELVRGSTRARSQNTVELVKLGYELHQGLNIYGLWQGLQAQLGNVLDKHSYGLGAHFMPRPHLELEALGLQENQALPRKLKSKTAWLMMHFYF